MATNLKNMCKTNNLCEEKFHFISIHLAFLIVKPKFVEKCAKRGVEAVGMVTEVAEQVDTGFKHLHNKFTQAINIRLVSYHFCSGVISVCKSGATEVST